MQDCPQKCRGCGRRGGQDGEEDEDGEEAAEDNEDESGEGGEFVEGGAYEDGRLVWTPKDGWLDGKTEFEWTLEHGWSDDVPDGIERTPQSVAIEQRAEPATIDREPPRRISAADRLAIQEAASFTS